MNTTVNGSSCSFLPNTTARRIGETFAYCLIFVVSLVGNSFVGIIVYKTQAFEKTYKLFQRQHAHVQLGVSNILVSAEYNMVVRGQSVVYQWCSWPGLV